MATVHVVSPEGRDREPTRAMIAPRLADVRGTTVAVHHNSKPGATELLAPIRDALVARGARVRDWSKAQAARPSPHLDDMAGAAQAAVLALGD